MKKIDVETPYIMADVSESGFPTIWERGGLGQHTVCVAGPDGQKKRAIFEVDPKHKKLGNKSALFVVNLNDVVAIGHTSSAGQVTPPLFYKVIGMNIFPSKEGKKVSRVFLKPIGNVRAWAFYTAFHNAFLKKMKSLEFGLSYGLRPFKYEKGL